MTSEGPFSKLIRAAATARKVMDADKRITVRLDIQEHWVSIWVRKESVITLSKCVPWDVIEISVLDVLSDEIILMVRYIMKLEAIDIEMGNVSETPDPDEPLPYPDGTKEEILAALDGSIQKWVGIVDDTMADQGPDNCPLCRMFWNDNCLGCPVADDTMVLQCGDTPYDEWTELRDKLKKNIGVADAPELKVASTNMLNYLVNLKKKLS